MKRKIIVGLMMLVGMFYIVKGGINAGIIRNISGDSYRNNASMGNSSIDGSSSIDAQENVPGDNNENIRYETFPIVSKVLEKDSYYDYSNSKLAWYMIRKDNHEPTGCDDTVDIYKYGGYHIDKNVTEDKKVMYLTFDCGYENGYTSQILDVLKEQNVPACFFVTQTYIRDNIDLVKRMKEEGHQVGNHTITHPSMPSKSYEEITNELEGCATYMAETTGYNMDPYLRPPMGEYSERTLKLSQDLGYKTIFWSITYLDFDVNKQPGADYVINHFEKYHHRGAIILMHNVSSSNADALETVLVNMKNKGYSFASLNELK